MAVVDTLDLSSVGNFIDHVLLELTAGHQARLEKANNDLAKVDEDSLDPARHDREFTKREKAIDAAAASVFESETALKDIEALTELIQKRPKDAAVHKALYLMMFVAGHSGDRMKEIFTERGHLVGQRSGGQAHGNIEQLRALKRMERLYRRAMKIYATLGKPASMPAAKLAEKTIESLSQQELERWAGLANPTEKETRSLRRKLAALIRQVADDSEDPSQGEDAAADSSILAQNLYADHDGDLNWRVWIAQRQLWHMGVIMRSNARRNHRRD